MTIRLSASSFAGTARTDVAVGTSKDEAILRATAAAIPRSGLVISWAVSGASGCASRASSGVIVAVGRGGAGGADGAAGGAAGAVGATVAVRADEFVAAGADPALGGGGAAGAATGVAVPATGGGLAAKYSRHDASTLAGSAKNC